jgi:hypothetical protein
VTKPTEEEVDAELLEKSCNMKVKLTQVKIDKICVEFWTKAG